MRFRVLCALVLLGYVAPMIQAAEVGQYRSRVQIDTSGQTEQGRVFSVEELERQIGGIEDPYAKSSAGRHLARHYVEQKEYDKAVDYYRTALAADGLSDIANREMLRELAQVYMLQEDYRAAAATMEQALAIDLVTSPGDYLLLARAHYHRRDYVAVVAALDRIGKEGLSLDLQQTRQALALYYRAGAWSQCEDLLGYLIEREPNNPEHWHQLAAVYLQQNKKRSALDQLTLARDKGVPFRDSDLLLLVDLKAVNGNPFGAAETLQQALSDREITANGENYRKLFELWFQAREQQRAARALVQAARLTGDTELYLYLAQLQMEQEAWADMHNTMKAACSNQLQDRFVGRANLFLGISQLKLGDRVGARRSFINATLIGGANVQAAHWLQYMEAEPATDRERRRIEGICYGSEDKRRDVADIGAAAAESEAGESEDFKVKEIPALRIYYSEYDESLAELAPRIRSEAMRLSINVVKSGGTILGAPQLIASGSGETARLKLAMPVRGAPRSSGKFHVGRAEAVQVAYRTIRGNSEELLQQAMEFAGSLQAAGYELTGERRLVFSQDSSGKGEGAEVELQLVVAP